MREEGKEGRRKGLTKARREKGKEGGRQNVIRRPSHTR